MTDSLSTPMGSIALCGTMALGFTTAGGGQTLGSRTARTNAWTLHV